MSSPKEWFIILPLEWLDRLGLVEVTLSGVLGFLTKCASKGEVFFVLFTFFAIGE